MVDPSLCGNATCNGASIGRRSARFQASALALLCVLSALPAFALSTGGEAIANEKSCPLAIKSALAEASNRFHLPVHWLRAVMHAESGGEAKSVSSKGAIGLMQIMPATYAELRTRYGLATRSTLTTIFWPEPPTFASCSTNMASTAFWRRITPVQGAMSTIFAVALCRPKRRIMSEGLSPHFHSADAPRHLFWFPPATAPLQSSWRSPRREGWTINSRDTARIPLSEPTDGHDILSFRRGQMSDNLQQICAQQAA